MFNKSYISVDLGGKNIKIVEGSTEKGEILINEYEIITTPEGVLEDGKVINIDLLVSSISEVIKRNKLKGKKLVLNISGTGIITRDVQLPKSTDEEIEKILQYEAQQHFPVELQNYVIDYKVQEEYDNGEGVYNRVFLVAVPVSQIDGYMEIHEKLKMDIEAIDISSNNVFKVLFDPSIKRAYNEDSDKETAVLDIGGSTTGIYIFSKEKLKFSRVLLNGSMTIDEHIGNNFSIDLKKSEELKIMMGRIIDQSDDVDEETARISGIIKPAVASIMNDVSRFFEFYNSRSSGNKLEKIYICGGGAKLLGLEEFLKGYFSIPVKVLNSMDYIKYRGKKSKELFESDLIMLVNAIGGLVRT